MTVHDHRHSIGGDAPVLDIGGEVGALVVHLTAMPASGELEACPADDVEHRFHTGVHRRPVGGSVVPVAVYPALHEGEYDILDDDLDALVRVRVAGGAVTELHIPKATIRRPLPVR